MIATYIIHRNLQNVHLHPVQELTDVPSSESNYLLNSGGQTWQKFVQYFRFKNYTDIIYPNFTIKEPYFSTVSDSLIFNNDHYNRYGLSVPSPEMLRGRIHLIDGGYARSSTDCGWQTDISMFLQIGKDNIRHSHEVLIPLLVPEAGSFQHFIDGLLPKLVQSYHILQHTNARLLIPTPRDVIIFQFLDQLNISRSKIVLDEGGTHYARKLILACIAPPLHPYLFKAARRMLRIRDDATVSPDVAFVVLVQRSHARNPGRRILNIHQIHAMLESRYQERLYVFKGNLDLEETNYLFSRSRIVIGVHGGGLYNMLFSPANTTVIEVMPVDRTGHVVPPTLAHTIIWKLANMFGHIYWRIYEQACTKFGSLKITEEKLKNVLDSID